MRIQGEGTKDAIMLCAHCGKEIPIGAPRRSYIEPENGKNIIKASMHERCFQELSGSRMN